MVTAPVLSAGLLKQDRPQRADPSPLCYVHWQRPRETRSRTTRRPTACDWLPRLPIPPTWPKARSWAWPSVPKSAVATADCRSHAGTCDSFYIFFFLFVFITSSTNEKVNKSSKTWLSWELVVILVIRYILPRGVMSCCWAGSDTAAAGGSHARFSAALAGTVTFWVEILRKKKRNK